MSETSSRDQRQTEGRVANSDSGTAFTHVESALHNLRYGVVTIVVQDGKIVKVEVTERTIFK
jgi:hypothetical protein